MSLVTPPMPSSLEPGPAWEIARLFPFQGEWSEGDYLVLNHLTNHLVELCNGRVEVLEMPTRSHQRIVQFLLEALQAFVRPRKLGEVIIAAYPVKIAEEKFREPDLVFFLEAHRDRIGEDFATGPDLVVEVVSQDRNRDLVIKRREYAEGGIPEYWIVDPRDKAITVLTLDGTAYREHGRFEPGGEATSLLLSGFGVRVNDVFGV